MAKLRKLNEEDVRNIRTSKEKGIDIAKRFGVTNSMITQIRQGKKYVEKDELPYSARENFGLILISALRYAHSRSSYITSPTSDYVLANLRFVSNKDLFVMIQDLDGCEHFGNPDIDGKMWVEFRNQLIEERAFRKMSKKKRNVDTFSKCIHGIDIGG